MIFDYWMRVPLVTRYSTRSIGTIEGSSAIINNLGEYFHAEATQDGSAGGGGSDSDRDGDAGRRRTLSRCAIRSQVA